MTDRRSATERRADVDRRRAKRRSRTDPVADDRRTTAERRRKSRRVGMDRRSGLDRRTAEQRRATPAPYSHDEVVQIRQGLFEGKARAACPRCHEDLTMGPKVRRGRLSVREIRCESCRRGVMIEEM